MTGVIALSCLDTIPYCERLEVGHLYGDIKVAKMSRRQFVRVLGGIGAGAAGMFFADCAGLHGSDGEVRTAGMASAAAAGAVPAGAVTGRKPNFVIIFFDDMGYGDLGCYGSKVNRTPAIDRMCGEGTKFTSFYVTSGVCSPSRSSLMTGCYPLRVGIHESSRGCFVLVPGDKRGLNPKEITIARLLKDQGYATGCIGKWHLGDQPAFFPTQFGFDYYFGIPFSNDMGSETNEDKNGKTPPLPLMRNETVIEAPVDQRTVERKYTAEAVKFIEANKDKPFFLYLPHMHVHLPYRPGKEFAGKSDNKEYGDMMAELDWSTGEILRAVKRLGLDDNTLVILTSDNGAIRRGSNAPLSGGKGTTMEGGMREPCVMRWPGKVPAGTICDEVCSTIDLLPTLARLAGTHEPTDRIIDGKDIADLMFGKLGAGSPHTEGFFYYFMSQLQAIRLGKWKLRLPLDPEIAGFTGQPKEKTEPRLFDLEADIGEKNNVASEHPDVVAKLTALVEKARNDIGDYKHKGAGAREPGYVEHPVFIEKEK